MFGLFKKEQKEMKQVNINAYIPSPSTEDDIKYRLTEAYWGYLCNSKKTWNEALAETLRITQEIYDNPEVRKNGKPYASVVLHREVKSFLEHQSFADTGILDTPIPNRKPAQYIAEAVMKLYINFETIATKFIRYNSKEINL